MAQPKTLWAFQTESDSVVIYNQGPSTYSRKLWEQLKTQEGYSDQDLAEVLNNFKP